MLKLWFINKLILSKIEIIKRLIFFRKNLKKKLNNLK